VLVTTFQEENIMTGIKTARITLCLLAIFILGTTATFAQTKTRVRFAKGKSDATIKGRIAKNQTRCFVLGTRIGQDVSGNLWSPANKVIFTDIGNGAFANNDAYTRNDTTQSRVYEMCIRNNGASTNFELVIQVY
jgi:hypothetical protein